MQHLAFTVLNLKINDNMEIIQMSLQFKVRRQWQQMKTQNEQKHLM